MLIESPAPQSSTSVWGLVGLPPTTDSDRKTAGSSFLLVCWHKPFIKRHKCRTGSSRATRGAYIVFLVFAAEPAGLTVTCFAVPQEAAQLRDRLLALRPPPPPTCSDTVTSGVRVTVQVQTLSVPLPFCICLLSSVAR